MAEHSGIIGYDSFHFVVENLDRSRTFYTERLDFKEVARSSDDLVKRGGQQSIVLGAGDVRVCVSTALSQSSKAARYLKKHPAGVMSLSFRVQDLDKTIAFLEPRGGTLLADPLEHKDERGGRYRSIEIATPLGDVAFRFVERTDYHAFAPGFTDVGAGHASRPENMFGITQVDHVTSNGLTMQPIIAFYRDVLGFQPFWDISFHTKDVAQERASGSGLKSIVMWDPESGVKFATNEPLRPFFYEIIQRAGDPGFGYGNFRALFESIERAQKTEQAKAEAARAAQPGRGTAQGSNKS